MGQPPHCAVREMGSWQIVLILGAVFSLTVSVATRYCTFVQCEPNAATTATSHALDAKRQHLLNDGLHWAAPVATFVLFKPTQVSSALPRDIPPVARLYCRECLCGRPPPSS